jgi:secreted PhoX family phosphatase
MQPNPVRTASRRQFLKLTSAVSLGFLGLRQFAGEPLAARPLSDVPFGYGPLVPDPKGILNLPRGFSYQIVSRQGDTMNDGLLVPGAPDGMATFPGPDGKMILVRNHEMSADNVKQGAFGKRNKLLSGIDKGRFYDFGRGEQPSLGGTTTLVYNPRTGKVESQYLSLAGTNRNCAGGQTPWGSWLTCEESTERAGGTVEQDHGYVFEVPAMGTTTFAEPVPLKAMGRFNHEAVCVDPRTGIVYLTEDRPDGLIYRFIPNTPGKLRDGGKLQALALLDAQSFDTRNWEALATPKLPANEPKKATWIDLENVEAPDDDLRLAGFSKGAARFARGEGMWFGRNELYLACTNGGHIAKGQIFRYTPSPNEGTPRESVNPGQLELFVEPNNTDLVKSCDNLTVSPWGDLVVCEDDVHPFVVGITPSGQFYRLAENVGFRSEFAGGVFSPDGSTYFVNIQHAGLTLAVTGPWRV